MNLRPAQHSGGAVVGVQAATLGPEKEVHLGARLHEGLLVRDLPDRLSLACHACLVNHLQGEGRNGQSSQLVALQQSVVLSTSRLPLQLRMLWHSRD